MLWGPAPHPVDGPLGPVLVLAGLGLCQPAEVEPDGRVEQLHKERRSLSGERQ